MRALPTGSEQTLDEEKPVAKGDRRRQLRVDEQSYEPIVPMKVANRRGSMPFCVDRDIKPDVW